MLFLSGICQTSNILKILFSILVIIKVAFIVVPIVLIVIIIINFLKSIIIKDNIIGKKLHIAIKRIIICLGIFFIPTVTLKEVQSQDNVSIILDKNPNGFVWPIPRIY